MRRKTGIFDIDGVEICEGDVITTDLGGIFKIYWDESKQILAARRMDVTDDEEILAIVKEQLGVDFFKLIPFQGEGSYLGFEDWYKIINP